MLLLSPLVVPLGITILVSWSLYRLTRYAYAHYQLYQSVKHLPGPPIHNPLVGHLGYFLTIVLKNRRSEYSRQLNKLMHQLVDTYGNNSCGLVRLWFGPFMPWIIVSDYKAVNLILTHPNALAKGRFIESLRMLAGQEFYTLPGVDSIKERKKLTEFFKLSNLHLYIDQLNVNIAKFTRQVEACQDGICPDMERLVANFVIDSLGDSICSTDFNAQTKENKQQEMINIMHEIMETVVIIQLTPWNYFLPFPKSLVQLICFLPIAIYGLKNFLKSKYFIWKLVRNRTKAVCKEMECTASYQPKSMLDSLIYKKLLKLDDNMVNIEANTSVVMLAALDTTISTLTWTIYMLAHHQKEQIKCQEEVDRFLEELKATNEPMNAFNLKRLKYLDCCIKEALRLVPPGPSFGRRSLGSIQLDETFTIPANVTLMLFADRIQRDGKLFREPHSFKPERFEMFDPAEGETPWCTNAALSGQFGAGFRSCIGKEYAFLALRLFFVNLLHKYSFTALDKYGDARPKHTFLQAAAHFPIAFTKRSH